MAESKVWKLIHQKKKGKINTYMECLIEGENGQRMYVSSKEYEKLKTA